MNINDLHGNTNSGGQSRAYQIHPDVRAKAAACIVYSVLKEYAKNPFAHTIDGLHKVAVALVEKQTSNPDWKYSARNLAKSTSQAKVQSVFPEGQNYFGAKLVAHKLIEVDEKEKYLTVKSQKGVCSGAKIPIANGKIRETIMSRTVGDYNKCIDAANTDMCEYLTSVLTPEIIDEAVKCFNHIDEPINDSRLFDELGLSRESFQRFAESHPIDLVGKYANYNVTT